MVSALCKDLCSATIASDCVDGQTNSLTLVSNQCGVSDDVVWVLRQDQHSIQRLRTAISVPLSVSVGSNSSTMSSWRDSLWDSKPARLYSQLWQMRSFAAGHAAPLQPFEVHSGLGCCHSGNMTFILFLLRESGAMQF